MAYGESCQWPASFVHACMALAAVVHAVEVSLIWLPLEPELQLPASRLRGLKNGCVRGHNSLTS
jgi:hypothetical protein